MGSNFSLFIFLNFVSDEELCEALYVCICEHSRRSMKQNLVGSSGLEPPTSRLSGVRSNHLSYEPIFGGDKRDRTADPLLAKQVLSQLSYTPTYLGAFSVLPLSRSLRTSKIKQRSLKKNPSKCFHFADLGVLMFLQHRFSLERR